MIHEPRATQTLILLFLCHNKEQWNGEEKKRKRTLCATCLHINREPPPLPLSLNLLVAKKRTHTKSLWRKRNQNNKERKKLNWTRSIAFIYIYLAMEYKIRRTFKDMSAFHLNHHTQIFSLDLMEWLVILWFYCCCGCCFVAGRKKKCVSLKIILPGRPTHINSLSLRMLYSVLLSLARYFYVYAWIKWHRSNWWFHSTTQFFFSSKCVPPPNVYVVYADSLKWIYFSGGYYRVWRWMDDSWAVECVRLCGLVL